MDTSNKNYLLLFIREQVEKMQMTLKKSMYRFDFSKNWFSLIYQTFFSY